MERCGQQGLFIGGEEDGRGQESTDNLKTCQRSTVVLTERGVEVEVEVWRWLGVGGVQPDRSARVIQRGHEWCFCVLKRDETEAKMGK